MLSFIHFCIICTYVEMVGCMFMWSPWASHTCSTGVRDWSSVLKDSTQWNNSWTPSFVCGTFLRVCGSARFVALTQVTPQESQVVSYRGRFIAEVSNKLHPSLAEKAEQASGWECVLGWGERENCSENWRNATKSKVTPVSYWAVSLYRNRRWSTRCQGQKKERKFSAYTRGWIW